MKLKEILARELNEGREPYSRAAKAIREMAVESQQEGFEVLKELDYKTIKMISVITDRIEECYAAQVRELSTRGENWTTVFFELKNKKDFLREDIAIISKKYGVAEFKSLNDNFRDVIEKLNKNEISIFNREVDEVLDRTKEDFKNFISKPLVFGKTGAKSAVKGFKEFAKEIDSISFDLLLKGDDSTGLKEERRNSLTDTTRGINLFLDSSVSPIIGHMEEWSENK